MSHHHHHHHSSSHSSSPSTPSANPIGGLDFSSALKNINLPSLATSLIGSMDITQLFGILAGLTSSPLKNTVTPQQFASPIIKKDTPPKEETREVEVEEEEDNESSSMEFNASTDSKEAKAEDTISTDPIQSLKFDPEKLSGMLNNLVNMLNTQPKP